MSEASCSIALIQITLAFLAVGCGARSSNPVILTHISGGDDAPIIATIDVSQEEICVTYGFDDVFCETTESKRVHHLLSWSLTKIDEKTMSSRPFSGGYSPEIWIEFDGGKLGYSLGSAPEQLAESLELLETIVQSKLDLPTTIRLVEKK